MYFIILLQQLIASTTHIVAKTITTDLSAPLVLLFRAGTASLAFVALFLFRREKFFRIERNDVPKFILLGALNIPLNQFLFLTAIKHTTAPNVALAYALTPAFVFILALIFLKEKATWMKLLGIAVAITGTVMILFEKGFSADSDHLLGNILGLLASLSWAMYTVLGKNFSQKYGAVYSIAMSMFIGFLLYIPVYFLTGTEFRVSTITLPQWGQIAYLGIVTSCIAYVLWYYALKHTDASKVSVFNNLQPILTTIMAVAFLGQSLTLIFIIGGILIIAGVYITQRS